MEQFCFDESATDQRDIVIRLHNYDYCRRDVFGADLPIYHKLVVGKSDGEEPGRRQLLTLGPRDNLDSLLHKAAQNPTEISSILNGLWDKALPTTEGISQVYNGYALTTTLDKDYGAPFCTSPLHPHAGRDGVIMGLVERGKNGSYNMKVQLPWGNLPLMTTETDRKNRLIRFFTHRGTKLATLAFNASHTQATLVEDVNGNEIAAIVYTFDGLKKSTSPRKLSVAIPKAGAPPSSPSSPTESRRRRPSFLRRLFNSTSRKNLVAPSIRGSSSSTSSLLHTARNPPDTNVYTSHPHHVTFKNKVRMR